MLTRLPGTWQAAPGEVENAVYHAIVDAGYRHIDCAYIYGNEAEVGTGLRRVFAEGNIKREDVFITTKLWSSYHSRAELGLQKSLDLLGLDYVDLYLMHWPAAFNANGNHPTQPTLPDGTRDIDRSWHFSQTWAGLEAVHASGRARAIGVSNFSIKYLAKLLETAKVVPAVNQVENHPLLPQTMLADFCAEKGIQVVAYSPFGGSGAPLLADPALVAIAQKAETGVGSVILNSLRGCSPFPGVRAFADGNLVCSSARHRGHPQVDQLEAD